MESVSPRLPLELIDSILAMLGDSADDDNRASRTALLLCFLVCKSFYTYAQKHFYRKFTIKYPIAHGKPLPEREHHLVQLFFDNPHIPGFIQELVVLFDGGHDTNDEIPHHNGHNSAVSHVALLDRFPWPNPPCTEVLDKVPPLLLLLRHGPIHTARFTLINAALNAVHVAGRQYLAPICSIPSMRRFYLVKMMPASLLDDEHPYFVPGLERLELLWVASNEKELSAPVDIPLIISSPPSTTSSCGQSVFPACQVIRTNRFNGWGCIWLLARRLFQSWFPDYTPSPELAKVLSVPWESKFVLDFPEVRDALDDIHNVCPSVRRVVLDTSWSRTSPFVEIIIERNV